jgi:hypothetical protein
MNIRLVPCKGSWSHGVFLPVATEYGSEGVHVSTHFEVLCGNVWLPVFFDYDIVANINRYYTTAGDVPASDLVEAVRSAMTVADVRRYLGKDSANVPDEAIESYLAKAGQLFLHNGCPVLSLLQGIKEERVIGHIRGCLRYSQYCCSHCHGTGMCDTGYRSDIGDCPQCNGTGGWVF